MVRALCYGSLGADLVHRLARLPRGGEDLRSEESWVSYGGGAANPAVAMATWGATVRVAGHTIGSDPLGELLLGELRRLGVDTGLLEKTASSTPHCVILLTGEERTIVSTGYRGVDWIGLDAHVFRDLDVVLVDGYSGPAGVAVAGEARAAGVSVVAADSASHCPADLLVWSLSDHSGSEIEEAARSGAVVITDGSRPVSVIEAGNRFRVLPPKVRAVDPTGAGDVFAAMCAYGLAAGWPLRDTVVRATAAGALLAAAGRRSGLPSIDAVEETAGAIRVEE